MNTILQKAVETHNLEKDEIIYLLSNDELSEELYTAADKVREEYVGNEVHLRGLIEFTNICRENCCYCGLRRDNTNLKRYRLTEEQIIDFAHKAVTYGYKTIVLQGGEDMYYTIESLERIVKAIKSFDVALTLSIGERPTQEYKRLKEAGADRFLMRIETTDKKLYEEMDPGMSHENRKRCLNDFKVLGYEVGSGSLVGLPGQTVESLADDILFFKEIDADMIGIGPFIPNADTPLRDASNNNFDMSLRVMAITRLLLPTINIPATTAMESLNSNGRIIALQSGANVVMPNLSPQDVRKKYMLYDNKICTGDEAAECRFCMQRRMESIGYEVVVSRGDFLA